MLRPRTRRLEVSRFAHNKALHYLARHSRVTREDWSQISKADAVMKKRHPVRGASIILAIFVRAICP
jgi:hypothetical protein